ncbi:MAG: hypothetical protein PHQ05_05015 [Sterolibacterium sp.]|nr:hypothetical protein [Sterolibacterium sp.]
MTKNEYRARVKTAVKRISKLPELVPEDFILTNRKAKQQRQRVELMPSDTAPKSPSGR